MAHENDSSAIDLQEPQRRLDQIVLPGDLETIVGELINEWKQSEKLARFGLAPRNRVLLYGPSGNGKTTLAEAVATELGVKLAYVRYSELVSKWVGETHKNIARVFEEARRFPSVLFFDEADSIGGARSEEGSAATKEKNLGVNTILLELDRMPATSVVIFATNFPDVLDSAMRRRINLTLEMPAPSLDDLCRLIKSLLKRNPLLRKPLEGFDVASCEATSFAQCEQLAIDHARRVILSCDDPLSLGGKPRSHLLRQMINEQKAEAS